MVTMILWLFLIVTPGDVPTIVMGAETQAACHSLRAEMVRQNATRPVTLQFTASDCVPLQVSKPDET